MKENKQIIVSALFKITIYPKDKTVIIHDRSTLKTNYYNMSDKKMDQILLEQKQPLTKEIINKLIKIMCE